MQLLFGWPFGGFGPNKWERIERDLPAFTGGAAPRLRQVADMDGDLVLEIRP